MSKKIIETSLQSLAWRSLISLYDLIHKSGILVDLSITQNIVLVVTCKGGVPGNQPDYPVVTGETGTVSQPHFPPLW